MARGADVYGAYARGRATKQGEAKGAVAQLGERLLCKQEVIGSIPFSSTKQVTEAARPGSARNHKQASERLLLAFCRTGSSVVL